MCAEKTVEWIGSSMIYSWPVCKISYKPGTLGAVQCEIPSGKPT